MKYTLRTLCLLVVSLLLTDLLRAYNLPYINLGLSSFLDGGPLRALPGFYFQNYLSYYNTSKFIDAQGNQQFKGLTPTINTLSMSPQIIWMRKKHLYKTARMGFDITLPLALVGDISKNPLGFKNNNKHIGDLVLGIFLQQDTFFYHDRPIFVQRFEIDFSLPTGSYSTAPGVTSPGNGFFFLSPYWAATLYCTEKFSASWRLNYLWCAKNKKKNTQAGQALHLNFTAEYFLSKRFLIGLSGYWLKQLTEVKQNDISLNNTKETVTALGPGIFYSFRDDFETIASLNFYKEFKVRNRTQGIKTVLRFLHHF